MDMTEFSGTCILLPPHKCYGRPINCLPHQIRESCSAKLGFGRKVRGQGKKMDGLLVIWFTCFLIITAKQK